MYIEFAVDTDRKEFEKKMIEINENHNVIECDFEKYENLFYYKAYCEKTGLNA